MKHFALAALAAALFNAPAQAQFNINSSRYCGGYSPKSSAARVAALRAQLATLEAKRQVLDAQLARQQERVRQAQREVARVQSQAHTARMQAQAERKRLSELQAQETTKRSKSRR